MSHPENRTSVYADHFPPGFQYRFSTSSARIQAGWTALRQGIWNRTAATHLERLLEQVRPDVAHLHHVHRHLTPSILEPLERHRIPIVWTVHDYELICPTAHLFRAGVPCEACLEHGYAQAIRHRCKGGSLAASLLVAGEKAWHRSLHLWSRVHRFIAPSHFLQQKLIRAGVASDHITFNANFLAVRQSPGPIPRSGPILFVGRLAKEKGIGTLLEAARLGLPAPVVIVGDGPQRGELEARASDLVAAGKVHFLGALSSSQVREQRARCRVVVVPSEWYENAPYAVLEGFEAGRPVVASRIGGIPEQVQQERTGLLVGPGVADELARAVTRLLDDPDLSAQLSSQAYQRLIEKYSPATYLKTLRKIYGEVLASG